MKIAVIGAGNVGSAIARAGMKTGNQVAISATDPTHARSAAEATGAKGAESNSSAVTDADLVVLAVPHAAVPTVAAEIAGAVAGRTVIDATNPLKPDGSGLAVVERSGAEELQDMLPQAHVVKAFNTVFASKQAEPTVDGVPLDGFYAGDDDAAKKRVGDFLAAIGYRPVDVGPLPAARALEHMAFVNITLNASHGWPWQSGWKLVGPTG